MATPPMEQNLRALLHAFNRHRVKYVIIGGYAVFVHAQPRMTKEMDVFIESSPANAAAIYEALTEFGAPLGDFTVEDFHTPTVCARFGRPPCCFDIVQEIAGIDFATVYKNSEELIVNGDLPVRYISAEDLITNKLASGRPQDLADAAAVQQAQSGRRGP
jgi:predicted nucleotidyltransferase